MKELNGSKGLQVEMGYKNPHIGKFCIIRCDYAGVHAGTVVAVDGRYVELQSARRLRVWQNKKIDGKRGVSLSELALYGLGEDCEINDTVPEISVLDACEIIPCSQNATESIINYDVHHV